MSNTQEFVGKFGSALAMTVLALAVLLAFFFAADVFMLIFLGVLFAVFLTRITDWMSRLLPVSYGWRLAAIAISMLFVLIVSCYFFGVAIASQAEETSRQLDKSTDQIQGWLQQNPQASALANQIPFAGQLFDVPTDPGLDHDQGALLDELKNAISGDESGDVSNSTQDPQKPTNDENAGQTNEAKPESDYSQFEQNDQPSSDSDVVQSTDATPSTETVAAASGRVFAGIGKLFSTTFGLLTSLALVLFVGLFIAVDPALYRDGVVLLFPPSRRERVGEVMDRMSDAMFAWLNGQFLAMAVTGTGTGLALWLLGVPLAVPIGVLTAVLTFVPNVGALTALVLASLMAVSQGTTTVFWVIVVYLGLQFFESNIFTPLVQQHQTSIPPALLVSFQLLMGVLFGFMGVLIAPPLLAVLMVLVNEIYVQDFLENDAPHSELSD